MEALNTRPFKKRVGNRRLAYENEEKELMQPIPKTPFELAVWSTATVQRDYLITDGINKYSVPFDLIGEEVALRTTKNTVEVFFHGDRVASHTRLLKAQRDPVYRVEHMPVAHQKYLSYNQDSFRSWAKDIGNFTERVIEFFLTADKEPEQGYKYCVGLMKLTERYNPSRIEKACERILSVTAQPSLRNIATILKNGQDRLPFEKNAEPVSLAGKHSKGITRGAAAFRDNSCT